MLPPLFGCGCIVLYRVTYVRDFLEPITTDLKNPIRKTEKYRCKQKSCSHSRLEYTE